MPPSPAAPETEPVDEAAATAEEVEAFMDREMKNNDDEVTATVAAAAAVADGAQMPVETTLAHESAASTANKTIPPAVAALDATLAPFMAAAVEKRKNQYIAVRVGYATCPSCVNSSASGAGPCPHATLRNAIFLSWDDARQFVEFSNKEEKVATTSDGIVKTVSFYSNVEWKAFYELDKAEAFLRKVSTPSTTAPPPQPKREPIKMPKKKKIEAKHKIKVMAIPNASASRNRGPPTKKWLQMYENASTYKSTHNHLEVLPTDTDNAALFKWIKYQRDQYRLYLEDAVGGAHSMTSEKVKLLSDLGFTWIEQDKMAAQGNAIVKKRGRPRKVRIQQVVPDQGDQSRGIRPEWMRMYEKLKAYVEQHGTTVIPKDVEDEESIALRQWCSVQKTRYSMLQKGQPAKGMTPKKIELLKSIGFHFPPNWNVMYSKLVEFKKEHQHVCVTEEHDADLAQWVSRQNEVLGRHLQGKGTRLSDEQVMKLLGLGMVGGRRAMEVQQAENERDDKWNEMFLQLRAFKAEHGHCNPPTSMCTDLSNWVAAQRRMYNKLISGKPGKRAVLDAMKMQRLTELGFQFRPRGSYLTWDEQMEKLRAFKQENNHCKVPVNHPVLGSFVKLARREYKLKQQGKKSSMTADRERELREMEFVFEGGKTPQRSEGKRKSWDERFEELLAFKEENGHTIVPQNAGRLGQWVHSQRVNYKKMKEGKPTAMTAEKALKLTEVGFCFNASDRFRGNKPEEKPQHEYPMYAEMQIPQLPTAEFAWRGRSYD